MSLSLCASTLVAVAVSSRSGEPGMEAFAEICPPGVMLLVEIPDFAAFHASLERSGLMGLWTSEQMRAYFEADQFGSETSFDDVLERAGVEVDSLAWPTGAAGAALIHDAGRLAALDAGPEAMVDVLLDAGDPQPLFAADFGAGADAAQAAFESLLDFAETHDLARIDGEHDDDRLVVVRSLVHERMVAAQDALQEEYRKRVDEAGEDWEKVREVWEWYEQASAHPEPSGDAEVDLLAAALADLPVIVFAREANVLLLAGDATVVSQALDRLEDPARPSAADEPFYGVLHPRLAPGAEGWFFFNLELSARFAEAAKTAREVYRERMTGSDDDGFDPFVATPLDVISDFFAFKGDGVGLSLAIDQGDALARIRFAAPTDAKAGAFALVDRTGLPFTLPAFAPHDAISVVRLLVDLPAIPAEVERLVNAMPQEARGQVRPAVDQAMPFLQQVCGSMGDEIHVISTRDGVSGDAIGLPGLEQLSGSLIAVALKDDRVLNNLLSAFGGTMGLQGRNVEGGTLFSAAQADVPFGLAIGSGRAFVGSVPQLEDALRALVHPVEPGEEPSPFDRARLDGRGPLAGFVRLKPMIEAIQRQADALRRQEANPDGEAVPGEGEGTLPPEFPFAVLLEHIGDVAFQADAPEWGFSGEIVVLRPKDE